MEYFPCLEEILITVEGNCPTNEFDVPEATDFKAQMLELYYKSLSCNVEIFVCESLDRKLTGAMKFSEEQILWERPTHKDNRN